MSSHCSSCGATASSMNSPAPRAPTISQARVAAGLKRRYAAERRCRVYGRIAVIVGLAFVVLLFGTIISKGYKAFVQAYVRVTVEFSAELLDPAGTRKPEDLAQADYGALVKAAMRAALPAVEGRVTPRRL